MSDLIKRQDAIRVVREYMIENQITDGDWHADGIERELYELTEVPSEIIRCENCKWSDWYTTAYGEKLCYCTEHDSSGHTVFDFCSYAERKE